MAAGCGRPWARPTVVRIIVVILISILVIMIVIIIVVMIVVIIVSSSRSSSSSSSRSSSSSSSSRSSIIISSNSSPGHVRLLDVVVAPAGGLCVRREIVETKQHTPLSYFKVLFISRFKQTLNSTNTLDTMISHVVMFQRLLLFHRCTLP